MIGKFSVPSTRFTTSPSAGIWFTPPWLQGHPKRNCDDWYDLVESANLATDTMETSYTLRDTIIDSVRSGQWRAGSRLPTERAFAEQFKLSRTTVRKVLLQLKEQGLVSQTVGSGTYVTAEAASIVRAWERISRTIDAQRPWQNLLPNPACCPTCRG